MNKELPNERPSEEASTLNDAKPFDPLAFDPVIDAYKQHVDRTILRENLRLSPQERSEKFLSFMESVWQLREAAEKNTQLLMPTRMDFAKAVTVLHEGEVEFIIVGGVAAILNGLGYTTYDLDVVYSRDIGNIQRLVRCLQPFSPYLRGAPPGLTAPMLRSFEPGVR